jgi:hypothetical protein
MDDKYRNDWNLTKILYQNPELFWFMPTVSYYEEWMPRNFYFSKLKSRTA